MTGERATNEVESLLDRAVRALNDGDMQTARRLADEVLAGDARNAEAVDLLAADRFGPGQVRRLTIMFCDLVDSTPLSGRLEPETYRWAIGQFKRVCRDAIDRHGGHVARVAGDGMLVFFGHPAAHEDDARRAVRAGLDITASVRRLSQQVAHEIGESLSVRVAVHRGLLYLDVDEGDIYGLAANVAARLQELAAPGTVVISREILRVVRDDVETVAQRPQKVKGLDEPLASWRVVGETGRPAGRRRTPLVGRAEELARLQRLWRERPAAVLVRGESGIGKSRLVAEMVHQVMGDGAARVELAGTPSGGGAGFAPVRTLAERQAGLSRGMTGPERVELLTRHLAGVGLDAGALVPLLAPVVGLAPDAGYAPATSDARKLFTEIAAAVEQYVLAHLDVGPAVLVVEDLQWHDASTRDLVAAIARRRLDGVLVVATGREDVASPAWATEVIDLGPLPEDACWSLVAALDPGGATAASRARLVARSDCVPLFLEELTRGVLEAAAGDATGTGLGWRATGDAGDDAVPELLYEPLVARLQTTDDGIEVAAAAAVIGRELDRDLLAEVAGIEPDRLDATLDALVRRHVLEPTDRPDHYRFRHELLRCVADDLQPPSARRLAHARAAEVLRRDGGDAVAVAAHFEAAERPVDAQDAYERAADAARQRGALGEARAHLDRALTIVSRLPATPARAGREIELLLGRGLLAVSSEGNASPAAGADFERCLALATDGGASDDLVAPLISLWGWYASRADVRSARQVLDLVRPLIDERRPGLLDQNEAGYGILRWYEGCFGEARERLEAAVAGAVESDPVLDWRLPNDPYASMWTHLALARFVTGDPAGAAEAFATAERRAAELPFPQGPFSAAYNDSYRAWALVEQGALDEGREVAERLRARSEAHGFDFWVLAATTSLAEADLLAAPTSAAAPVLGGLAAMWRMLGADLFLPQVTTMWAAALVAAGDPDGAREHLTDAVSFAESTGVAFYEVETRRRLALLAPDPGATEAGLRAALDVARAQGAAVYELRVACDLVAIAGPAAHPLVDEALGRFAPRASSPELDAAWGLVRAS
jgi:class 3 adenylate cyclase/tetratricopeptide (TPR) repeat protein